MPDCHSGYGFAIGNVAAFDMADPAAVVSPGGVGFDINCGVRLLRTNLTIDDVGPVRQQLTQALFNHIPVGVGSQAPPRPPPPPPIAIPLLLLLLHPVPLCFVPRQPPRRVRPCGAPPSPGG